MRRSLIVLAILAAFTALPSGARAFDQTKQHPTNLTWMAVAGDAFLSTSQNSVVRPIPHVNQAAYTGWMPGDKFVVFQWRQSRNWQTGQTVLSHSGQRVELFDDAIQLPAVSFYGPFNCGSNAHTYIRCHPPGGPAYDSFTNIPTLLNRTNMRAPRPDGTDEPVYIICLLGRAESTLDVGHQILENGNTGFLLPCPKPTGPLAALCYAFHAPNQWPYSEIYVHTFLVRPGCFGHRVDMNFTVTSRNGLGTEAAITSVYYVPTLPVNSWSGH